MLLGTHNYNMFKKNPNRPPMVIALKRVQGGYKVMPNEGHSLFQVKRIIRTMYRPDLAPQGSGLRLQQNGMSIPSTIIQPPSHFTFPAFSAWFSLEDIHHIEQEAFAEFFEEEKQSLPFSFGIRNAKLYKYYRNTMVGMWLENVKKHLSAAHCRRTLAGDVSLIVRIHGFLENWGIINFPSREHNKGLQVKESQRLTCYMCQQAESKVYYVAQVEELIFQLCENCFRQGLYPSQMEQNQFVQVLHSNYEQPKHRIMSNSQLIRLLDCFTANGGSREKEKDMWAAAQKEFSQFTREELAYNFLRIPMGSEMNASIFQNNEDLKLQKQPEEVPTIFEDFQNPLQTSIAVAYYKLKQKEDEDGRISRIFSAGEKHSRLLADLQEEKIEELTKMLVDVSFSKLQLKSIFIQEYQQLVEKCLVSQRSSISNIMAESLKQNIRFIESNCDPQQLCSRQQAQGNPSLN